MAASDLHVLIKSLDKAECSRVRKNAKAAKKDGTKYLELFDALSQLETYTTDKAFLSARKEAPYRRSFPQMKGYLFDFILDALRSYRTRMPVEKARDFEIRDLIEEAQILRSKLLLAPSLQRLEKARAEAVACQHYELLLETLKLIRTHLNEQAQKDKAKELQGTLQSILEVGALIHLNCQLIVFRDELFTYVRRNSNPDPALLSQLSEKIANIKILGALESGSLEAKTNHHLSFALYEWINGEKVLSWQHHHTVFLLWRNAVDFAKERKVQHIKLLNNFLTTSIAAGQSEDFIDALEILEKCAGPSVESRAESKQNTAYIRLQYYLSRAEWENALTLEEEFNEKPTWVTQKTNVPRLQVFYLSFACLHFVLDDHKNAHKYLDRFDEECVSSVHDDKRAEAIALRLIISFCNPRKVVDLSAVESDIINDIRAARRGLRRLYNPAPYLDELLRGLKKLANTVENRRPNLWKKLHAKIKGIGGSEQYDSASQLFIAWLQSKADGMPLRTLLQTAFPKYQLEDDSTPSNSKPASHQRPPHRLT
jgi:hypothetical protein